MCGDGAGCARRGRRGGLRGRVVSSWCVCRCVWAKVFALVHYERAVASPARGRESWRAAFGITVTMVWLYIEILRILSYFRD